MSTANDLVKFISAELGFTASPLSRAMAAQLAARRPATLPGTSQIALGWLVSKTDEGNEIVFHTGGTTGFAAIVCYDKRRRLAGSPF